MSPLGRVGVDTACIAWHPTSDRLDVRHVDVAPHGARLLRGAQQLTEQRRGTSSSASGIAVSTSMPEPGERVGQARSVAPHCSTIDRRNVNSASPGSSAASSARPSSTMRADPVLDDRPEQILLGREVPVDGAGADAGPPGDLVDRHRQPLGGERLVGDLEHAGAVAGRVRAQRPVGLSHSHTSGNGLSGACVPYSRNQPGRTLRLTL